MEHYSLLMVRINQTLSDFTFFLFFITPLLQSDFPSPFFKNWHIEKGETGGKQKGGGGSGGGGGWNEEGEHQKELQGKAIIGGQEGKRVLRGADQRGRASLWSTMK